VVVVVRISGMPCFNCSDMVARRVEGSGDASRQDDRSMSPAAPEKQSKCACMGRDVGVWMEDRWCWVVVVVGWL